MNSTEFLKYYRDPERCGAVEVPLWEELLREYPWFQAGWMLYLKSLRAAGDPAFEERLHQGALRIRDRKLLRKVLQGDHAPDASVTPSGEYLPTGDFLLPGDAGKTEIHGQESHDTSPKQQLIEKFLSGGGAFGTLRGDPPSSPGIDHSERAGEVSGDIITETFASLLVQQGKYAEAIDAFEKLSLRFPGKSIYFAARIEEVKNIMNY